MSDSDDQLVEQAKYICDLSDENADLRTKLSAVLDKVQDLEDAQGEPEGYYARVYSDIRSARDAWAFAELGTASPTPLDLEGRPELAALWESIK